MYELVPVTSMGSKADLSSRKLRDLQWQSFIGLGRRESGVWAQTGHHIWGCERCCLYAAAMMSDIYEDHKDQDGFLYITYSGESTFGRIWGQAVCKTPGGVYYCKLTGWRIWCVYSTVPAVAYTFVLFTSHPDLEYSQDQLSSVPGTPLLSLSQC